NVGHLPGSLRFGHRPDRRNARLRHGDTSAVGPGRFDYGCQRRVVEAREGETERNHGTDENPAREPRNPIQEEAKAGTTEEIRNTRKKAESRNRGTRAKTESALLSLIRLSFRVFRISSVVPVWGHNRGCAAPGFPPL